jgi:hypothetical protein
MSNQSSLLQRSYSEEDLEKLKHLMSFRTYPDFEGKVERGHDFSNNKGRIARQEAYQAFKTKLNEMCDE